MEGDHSQLHSSTDISIGDGVLHSDVTTCVPLRPAKRVVSAVETDAAQSQPVRELIQKFERLHSDDPCRTDFDIPPYDAPVVCHSRGGSTASHSVAEKSIKAITLPSKEDDKTPRVVSGRNPAFTINFGATKGYVRHRCISLLFDMNATIDLEAELEDGSEAFMFGMASRTTKPGPTFRVKVERIENDNEEALLDCMIEHVRHGAVKHRDGASTDDDDDDSSSSTSEVHRQQEDRRHQELSIKAAADDDDHERNVRLNGRLKREDQSRSEEASSHSVSSSKRSAAELIGNNEIPSTPKPVDPLQHHTEIKKESSSQSCPTPRVNDDINGCTTAAQSCETDLIDMQDQHHPQALAFGASQTEDARSNESVSEKGSLDDVLSMKTSPRWGNVVPASDADEGQVDEEVIIPRDGASSTTSPRPVDGEVIKARDGASSTTSPRPVDGEVIIPRDGASSTTSPRPVDGEVIIPRDGAWSTTSPRPVDDCDSNVAAEDNAKHSDDDSATREGGVIYIEVDGTDDEMDAPDCGVPSEGNRVSGEVVVMSDNDVRDDMQSDAIPEGSNMEDMGEASTHIEWRSAGSALDAKEGQSTDGNVSSEAVFSLNTPNHVETFVSHEAVIQDRGAPMETELSEDEPQPGMGSRYRSIETPHLSHTEQSPRPGVCVSCEQVDSDYTPQHHFDQENCFSDTHSDLIQTEDATLETAIETPEAASKEISSHVTNEECPSEGSANADEELGSNVRNNSVSPEVDGLDVPFSGKNAWRGSNAACGLPRMPFSAASPLNDLLSAALQAVAPPDPRPPIGSEKICCLDEDNIDGAHLRCRSPLRHILYTVSNLREPPLQTDAISDQASGIAESQEWQRGNASDSMMTGSRMEAASQDEATHDDYETEDIPHMDGGEDEMEYSLGAMPREVHDVHRDIQEEVEQQTSTAHYYVTPPMESPPRSELSPRPHYLARRLTPPSLPRDEERSHSVDCRGEHRVLSDHSMGRSLSGPVSLDQHRLDRDNMMDSEDYTATHESTLNAHTGRQSSECTPDNDTRPKMTRARKRREQRKRRKQRLLAAAQAAAADAHHSTIAFNVDGRPFGVLTGCMHQQGAVIMANFDGNHEMPPALTRCLGQPQSADELRDCEKADDAIKYLSQVCEEERRLMNAEDDATLRSQPSAIPASYVESTVEQLIKHAMTTPEGD